MSAIQPKDFQKQQEEALEELEKTALIRAAVEIVSAPAGADEDTKQQADLKRKYDATGSEAREREARTEVDAVARLMSGRQYVFR